MSVARISTCFDSRDQVKGRLINFVQHTSDHYMLFCHTLPLVVNHCSKHSKPLGTPSKLIQILCDGNCLFRALSVSSRQICYTRVRAQIINHMNSSLDSYLVNGQMARNI